MPVQPSALLPVVLALALPLVCLATETAPEKPAEAAPLDDAVVPPQIIVKTQKVPSYPPAAKAARFDGTVHVSLTILPDGTVGSAEVVQCDHPNVGFEAASIEAAKQWKFSPARKDDQPIEYVTTFRITFRTMAGSGPGNVMVMVGSAQSTSDEREAGMVQPKVIPAAPSPNPKR